MLKGSEQKSLCSPRARWGWVIFVGIILLGSWRAIAGFDATLDRNTIAIGESATLTLTFENCTPGSEPVIPRVANLEIGNYISQATRMFNQSITITRDYPVRPAKEGDYVIPPIRVTLNNGQQVVSKPLTLKVSKSPLPAPAGTPEPAFVKLIIPRQQIYLGETIPVNLQCYLCQRADNVQRPHLEASGFTTGPVSDYDKPIQQVRYAGQVYSQLIFHAPISPAKTGTLTLGPASWSLSLLVGQPDFWGRYSQSKPVTVSSEPLEIQVLPLPTNNMPAGFSGAIGTFALASFNAGPTNVAVGDPITLKIRISGAGNFNLVTLPQNQPQWGDFKLYPPASKFEPTDALETEGSKYFEQVVLPQNSSIKELPPILFSFFDPVKKMYQTLATPAVPITVRPTAATPQPTVFSSATQPADAPPPAREIVHIKPALGKVVRAEPPLLLRPGFWVLQALGPLLWVGAWVWRRRRDNLANNPRLVRQREVARLVRQGLKELPALARANKKDDFYAAVFRLLQEVLGERLDLPASGITEIVVESLNDANVDPAALSSARELFKACNQYRYAPERGGEELESLLPKIKTTLAGLQQAKAQPGAGAKGLATAGLMAACLVAGTLHAQSPAKPLDVAPMAVSDLSSEFTAANRLYELGRFAEAAVRYDQMIQNGWRSSTLFFNSGNAWFKAGQAGRAILAYRKAERLSPRDPDVRANLQFARTEAGNASLRLPGNQWLRLLNRLTLNEWTVLAGTATALFFVVLAFQQLAPGRKCSRATIISLGLLSAILIGCLAATAQTQLDDPLAVVISADTTVRRGPFAESPSVATAHDGTELLVIDSNADWFEVIDAARHTGWVPKADVGRVQ